MQGNLYTEIQIRSLLLLFIDFFFFPYQFITAHIMYVLGTSWGPEMQQGNQERKILIVIWKWGPEMCVLSPCGLQSLYRNNWRNSR